MLSRFSFMTKSLSSFSSSRISKVSGSKAQTSLAIRLTDHQQHFRRVSYFERARTEAPAIFDAVEPSELAPVQTLSLYRLASALLLSTNTSRYAFWLASMLLNAVQQWKYDVLLP
ncbi:hypothetical protein HDV57DRAFT_495101 [Trichoderma longibrachiatum]